jgi:hypothetical protein
MEQMDLNILSLARREGQELIEPSGLFIASPPRRPARGRQSDRLILYLTIAGNAPLPDDQQGQLLARLAQTYYNTPGSVTAAQRASADALNQYLLDRNQRAAISGHQGIGLFGIMVVRNDRLYLALCGPMQAFLINAAGAKHIEDLQTVGLGLGLGRTTPILYSQSDLNPNDTLLLSPTPPPAWTASKLSGLHNQGPESLRRNLLSQAGPTLNACLLQARQGTGKTFFLRPKPGQAISYVQPKPETVLSPAKDEPSPGYIPQAATSQIAIDRGVISQVPEPAVKPQPVPSADIQPEGVATEETSLTAAVLPKERAPRRTPGRDGFSYIGLTITGALARAGLGIRNLLLRMLPGESIATLPSSVMIIVAVAVPLVVVTIAAVVYFQRGRTGQYQAYYAQAVQAAGYARSQTDPFLRTEAWQSVINYLEQAESYQVNTETQALRDEANQSFDLLNLVRRLDYQPAITGKLPESTKITHLVATESDLYLLNAEGSNVIRSLSTGSGYEIDPTFQCAAGAPAGQSGVPIDIVPAPKNNEFAATVLALDVNGNLLNCVPGQPPVFTPLAPPTKGWGNPQALTIDLGHLYVLDPDKNTVWIYWNSDYTQPPEEFFIADFPMQSVIDLVVDKSELYLLHEDGHTTLCTYSDLSVAPSRCTDPLPYIDSRPGREGQTMTIEPPFIQVLATQPPDPSLYFLQSQEQALYRYSLRVLTYYGQFRPQSNPATGVVVSLNRPATAFTLSPDARIAFLAEGNQVFYAVLQ